MSWSEQALQTMLKTNPDLRVHGDVTPLQGRNKPSKYRNVKCEADGITFDSRRERDYFLTLKAQQERGEILGFVRQVSVPIGKSKRRMRLDFVVFHFGGKVEWLDAKGCVSPEWAIKRDELEANTPIRVRTV